MHCPEFFEAAPRITMYDPLAHFLGAVSDGLIEYRYTDAVRVAGHSCPTVAAAWLMTVRALRALYAEAVPERGAIRVAFRQAATSGVTGVMANVVSLVTGATHDTGFKGLGGRFDRRRLLSFGVPMEGEIRFTRTDNGAAVEVAARLERVPADPRLGERMAACLAGTATAAAAEEFRRLWQERVRRLLLEHAGDERTITVRVV